MANDIKQRIVLEGEKEYSAAIKEAKRNLGVLRSELKAETAELGKNATAQEKNAAKVKNLQKQIAEQEKVVKTYESALKEVKEKYGDNEEAIAKWEVKLNDARTALANMKNSLSDTDTGIKQTTTDMNTGVTAANSLADSFSKLGEVGSSISSTLESAFTTVVETIYRTVESVWNSVTDLAARSNNMVDLAGYWNTDVTTIQKYKGAVAEASGSLEDLNSLVTKINSYDAKKIATLTGVSNVNYEDQWKYAMAVMDAMSQMDAKTRNATGFEIFGKGATKAFDLLNDWKTVQDNLGKYDVTQGGYGLTEEELQNMSDLYDKVNGLKESWQALKDMATVKLFGDLALNITGNLQNIVDAFKEYFQAEDDAGRAKAMENIKTNLVKIFEKIRDAINEGLTMLGQLSEELKNSGDPTAQLLGEVLGSIVSALQWFADESNWGKVQTAFDTLIGLWAAGRVGTAIAQMASFGSHLTTIGRFFGWGNNGTATAQTTTTTPTVSTKNGQPFLTGLLNNLVTGAGVSFLFDEYQRIEDNLNHEVEKLDLDGLSDDEKHKRIDMAAFGMTEEEYEEIQKKSTLGTSDGHSFEFQEESAPVSYGFTESMRNAAETFWDQLRDDGMFSDEEWDAFEKAFENNPEQWDKINELIDDYLTSFPTVADYSEDLPADWWTGGSNNSENEDNTGLTSAIVGLPKNVASAVSNIKVIMDGQEVGTLVAPYVSESIARNIY